MQENDQDFSQTNKNYFFTMHENMGPAYCYCLVIIIFKLCLILGLIYFFIISLVVYKIKDVKYYIITLKHKCFVF